LSQVPRHLPILMGNSNLTLKRTQEQATPVPRPVMLRDLLGLSDAFKQPWPMAQTKTLDMFFPWPRDGAQMIQGRPKT
jgi:hypothetical protein